MPRWTRRKTMAVAILGPVALMSPAAWLSTPWLPFATALPVAVAAAVFLTPLLAVQLHRRGRRGAGRSGGAGAALGTLGVSVALLAHMAQASGIGSIGRPTWVALLFFAPLFAGLMGMLGTRILARGVDQYRARHGLVHAPASFRG